MAQNKVLETIGKSKLHEPQYERSDWFTRDQFENIDRAREYAEWKSRQYPNTPYRIRLMRGRYSVEFVPEWKLR